MVVDSVSSVSSVSQGALQNGGKITASGSSSLDMNDFFTLMAAELQYQDPSSSTDTSQYMGQMAQFGMLEQLESIAKQYNYLLGSSLIGKNVSYSVFDEATGETTTGSGTVNAVDVSSTSPSCSVDGKWVSVSNITGFSAQSASSENI